MILYRIAHVLFSVIWKIFYNIKIIGRENIPCTGGVIIAANHISSFDPPVVGCAVPVERQVHFMAKEELFTNSLISSIFKIVGTFPVKRGAPDRTALKKAIEILSRGDVLGLFPEGTRSKNGVLGEAEQGMAIIANKAGAVIVPTAIKGTADFSPKKRIFRRIVVRFGKPITVNKGELNKEAMMGLNKKVMADIAELLKVEEN